MGVAAFVGQSTSMVSYDPCSGGRNTQSVTSIFRVRNLPNNAGISLQPFNVGICPVTPNNSWVWPPLSLISKECCPEIVTTFFFISGELVREKTLRVSSQHFRIWLHVLSRRPCGKKRHRLVLTCTQCPAQSLPSCSGADRHFATNSLFQPRRCPMCFETYQLPHLTTCGGEKAFSLCRNLRHLAAEFTLRYLVQTTQDADPRSGKKTQQRQSRVLPAKSHQSETGRTAPLQFGRLRRPSTTRVTGSLGYSPRATEANQKSAGRKGRVHQGCRLRSEVQKGRLLPLRV